MRLRLVMMMMMILALGLSLGCSKPAPAPTTSRVAPGTLPISSGHPRAPALDPRTTLAADPPLRTIASDHNYIKEWKARAKARKFYWKIGCFDWVTVGNSIYGYASIHHQIGTVIGDAIEDGAKPEWWITGTSQEEVARKLLELTDEAENWHPKHHQEAKASPHKYCPPPLSGEPR